MPEDNENLLGTMSWEDLINLRKKYEGNQEMQNYLAPYEHQAFSRELTQEKPYMAASLGAAVPAYYLYKLATGKGRSEASLDTVQGGYKGILQGLQEAVRRRF